MIVASLGQIHLFLRMCESYIKFDHGTVCDAKAWIWFGFDLDKYVGPVTLI